MLIELTHPFKTRCHDIKGLLDGVNKMSTFCTRLEKQASLHPNRYDPDRYKGDGFELFVEALIKLFPVDGRIGVANYTPIVTDDTGADGIGIGMNGKPATVQVKFRSNNTVLLKANEDHLSNFITASQNKYGVSVEDVDNMLIVTTAENLHPFTHDEMLYKKVRCIGWNDLRALVDNNSLFWNAFRKLCGVGS